MCIRDRYTSRWRRSRPRGSPATRPSLLGNNLQEEVPSIGVNDPAVGKLRFTSGSNSVRCEITAAHVKGPRNPGGTAETEGAILRRLLVVARREDSYSQSHPQPRTIGAMTASGT